ncbi:hypothetical protein NLO413_0313 [Candidatus Neoehrlichia lotoris str. RAC413]|uniref:Uncharacterized protein n=1 Tax=Candidatus Neoehrlichia procyonis str. RAC413 TaxID=1359163 RepID=A0A0F3NMK9_9RICK|nr:hypothetical protein NLO413_0313 [Candidatus Neoehrlichia lotoris str. RAC413]
MSKSKKIKTSDRKKNLSSALKANITRRKNKKRNMQDA